MQEHLGREPRMGPDAWETQRPEVIRGRQRWQHGRKAVAVESIVVAPVDLAEGVQQFPGVLFGAGALCDAKPRCIKTNLQRRFIRLLASPRGAIDA